MELQQQQPLSQNYEPFVIIYNARKNSKYLKSTASKSRKNSVLSTTDEKQKKKKKSSRKLTEFWNDEQKWFNPVKEYSEKKNQNESVQKQAIFLEFEQDSINLQQKQKQQIGGQFIQDKEEEENFYFVDGEGEIGIMQGIGDRKSLENQLNFDFFSEEKYSK